MAQAIFAEGAAPATPATGKVAVYAKTDGKMYALDDAGLERSLGGDAASTTQAGIVELATEAECVTGTSTTLVPSVDSFRKANIISGTAIATTSGTSHDFTGIPSWVKRITVMLDAVSTNGTSAHCIQIGDSGGIENSGYSGGAEVNLGRVSNSTAFLLSRLNVAGDSCAGVTTLVKMSGNTWMESGIYSQNTTNFIAYSTGAKTLSATLDSIRITTSGGADTFDAGTINILYE